MSLVKLIRLILSHWKVVVIFPILVVCLVYFLVRNEKLTYTTSSTLYTGFASGKSITNSESRVDFFAVKTRFDNLFSNFKSRSNKEEIALRILSYYLSKDSISQKDMTLENQEVFYSVFKSDYLDNYKVIGDVEKTYGLIYDLYYSDFTNEAYMLLNSKYSPLKDFISIDLLASIQAYQDGNSDRVIVNFSSTDPGVCYHTVRLAVEVIVDYARKIKSEESENVVQYFKTEAEKAKKKLEQSEGELSAFMIQNNVINYYEQTRYIAERKENFEVAYQEEKLVFSAASAAEREALEQLNVGVGLGNKKQEIDTLRIKLRTVSSEIAFIEFSLNDDISALSDSIDIDTTHYQYLRNVKVELQNKLEREVIEMHKMDHNISGLSYQDISLEWLEAVIDVEESLAKLEQYDIFRKQFEYTYGTFSQLGSKIKQLERKIGVLEEDYLDLLASLNDSKLLQQSIELTSNLRVVDPPYYPVNSGSSTKLIALVVSLFGSGIIVVAILVLIEFFDNSIKSIENAELLTQTQVYGGMPFLTSDLIKSNRDLVKKLTNQLKTAIGFRRLKQGVSNRPFVVLFVSTREQEGKSLLSRLVAREMRMSKHSTCLYMPGNSDAENLILSDVSDDNYYYDENNVNADLTKALDEAVKTNQDYVFVELSNIIGSELSVDLVQKADLSILVLKSTRVWNGADDKALSNYKGIVNHEIFSMINGADIYELESLLGEVPKKRSKIRARIKQIAKFQFNNHKF